MTLKELLDIVGEGIEAANPFCRYYDDDGRPCNDPPPEVLVLINAVSYAHEDAGFTGDVAVIVDAVEQRFGHMLEFIQQCIKNLDRLKRIATSMTVSKEEEAKKKASMEAVRRRTAKRSARRLLAAKLRSSALNGTPGQPGDS